MARGRVTWKTTIYGFITPDAPGMQDVWFHKSYCPGCWEHLKAGTPVDFSVRQSRKKADKLEGFDVELAPVTFASAA